MVFKTDKQRKFVMAKLTSSQRADLFPKISPLKVRTNRLPIQFSIIVPSTKLDKKIKASEFNRRVDAEKRFMDKTFGGDTTVKAVGSFVLTKGKKETLIKEKTAVVEISTTTKNFNANRAKLIAHLKQRKKQWKQNSLFFKVEGEAFIFPKQSFIPDEKTKRKIAVT